MLSGQWIVLTAAHCIETDYEMIVYAGIVDLGKFTSAGNTYQAISVHDHRLHPQYDPVIEDYDIGLLMLSSSLKLNSKIRVSLDH